MGLEGRSVLLTRARGQNAPLRALLEGFGATVVEVPTIEIQEPESWDEVDAALGRIEEYDWIVFTSANAVEAIRSRTRTPLPTPPEVAVVGRQTAHRVEAAGLSVRLIPDHYRAEGLLEALPDDLEGVRFLLPRGDIASDLLPSALRSRGAGVDEVVVYRTALPSGGREDLLACLDGRPDCVTFTSGSTVRNLVGMLPGPNPEARLNETAIAVIGPITRQEVEAYGLEVAIEPSEVSIPALAEAIREYFTDR